MTKSPVPQDKKCARCGVGFRPTDTPVDTTVSLVGGGKKASDKTWIRYHPTCAIKEACDLIYESRRITKEAGRTFRI